MRGVSFALVALGLAGAPALAHGQASVEAPAAAPSRSDGTSIDDPVRVSLANHLLDLIHLEQQYDRVFSQILPVTTAQIMEGLRNNEKIPAAMRTALTGSEGERIFSEEAMKGFRASYPAFRKTTVAEYAKSFTAEELRQIVAFYESAAGQKTLSIMPAIQSKLMATGMAVGQEIGRQAMARTINRLHLDPPAPKT